MTDPTPQPLQHAHDDLCADDIGGDGVRNIYVRRVGEALDDEGQIVRVREAAQRSVAKPASGVTGKRKRKHTGQAT